MDKADKVISAYPIAKMYKNIEKLTFEVVSQNGFFAAINGARILEFDTIQDANKTVSALNSAIKNVADNFKFDYDKKIGDLIA